jgi:hypothetical protein
MTLALASALVGRAGAAVGDPIKGVSIGLGKKPNPSATSIPVEMNGRINLGTLAPGDYTLTLTPDDFRRLTSDGLKAEIEITGAARVMRVDMRRAAEGGIDFSVKAAGPVAAQVTRTEGPRPNLPPAAPMPLPATGAMPRPMPMPAPAPVPAPAPPSPATGSPAPTPVKPVN